MSRPRQQQNMNSGSYAAKPGQGIALAPVIINRPHTIATKTICPKILSQDLRYEPETGLFFRPSSTRQYRKESEAGSIDDRGYRMISIRGVKFKAARLAYVLMTGKQVPNGMVIDHIDRDRSNDRWSNLRAVTQSINMTNRTFRPKAASYYNQYITRRTAKSWHVAVTIGGKRIRKAGFTSLEDAIKFRDDLIKQRSACA